MAAAAWHASVSSHQAHAFVGTHNQKPCLKQYPMMKYNTPNGSSIRRPAQETMLAMLYRVKVAGNGGRRRGWVEVRRGGVGCGGVGWVEVRLGVGVPLGHQHTLYIKDAPPPASFFYILSRKCHLAGHLFFTTNVIEMFKPMMTTTFLTRLSLYV